MLRTTAFIILIMFSANTAFALTAKEVVTSGKILASGAYESYIRMIVHFKGDLYSCDMMYEFLECYEQEEDEITRAD